MEHDPKFVPYRGPRYEESESLSRAAEHRAYMNLRRSVRHFSDRPVPRALIEDLIATASTAPSGAHKQPWTFCVVSDDELKAKMRAAAEKSHERGEAAATDRQRAMSWAQRLRRVFAIDVETCRQCGGKLRVIASIEAPAVIERILEHLGRDAGSVDSAHPGRAPPARDTSL